MTAPSAAFPTEIAGLNFYRIDAPLQRLLQRRSGTALAPWQETLDGFGAWVGGPCDAQAMYTDRHARPVLEAFDKNGVRTNHIRHNPAWEDASREVYKRGIVGLNYGPEPAPYLLTFAMGYILAQADISLHCPVTMTGAVAYVLDRFAPADVKATYLTQLTRQDGAALSGGTWATELHGGSDIGATTTVATPVTGKPGEVRLKGLKWFTSNANGGLALATARPFGENAPGTKGLGVYLVPTHLADGSPNPMLIRRLKDKLGTCGIPTGEIDLLDTWAVEVAPPPRGFKLMMDALSFSRIHNAMAGAGIQRRAFLEAAAFACHREAFGQPITAYPMVQTELLHMLAPQQAGLNLALTAAAAFDAAATVDVDDAGHPARVWLRLTTALAKYFTAEESIRASSRAIEVIGGNGYVYDRITPRLLRDAQVLSVWEGPANIQALELLRLLGDKLGGFALFDKHLTAILEGLPAAQLAQAAGVDVAALLAQAQLDCRTAAQLLAGDAAEAQRHARRLLDFMAQILGFALLLEQAAADLASGDHTTVLLARWFAETRLAPVAQHGIVAGQGWAEEQFGALLAAHLGRGV